MSKKLLHKTQRAYLIYSTITLIIVAPLFLFITKSIYINDIDETLMLHKSEFFRNKLPKLKKEDIPYINKFNNDIKEVAIININGVVIKKIENPVSDKAINIHKLIEGVYLMKITYSNDNTIIKRFVKL